MGIREAWSWLQRAVGLGGDEPVPEEFPPPAVELAPAPARDEYTAEPPPAAPVAPAASLERAPAARLAAGAAAAAPDPSARMVDHLEYWARETGAPDGTSISPDNTSRWIAEFVVRRFTPLDERAGELAVDAVINAYRFGIEHYLVRELGFLQRERRAHDAVRASLEGISTHVIVTERATSLEFIREIRQGINAFLGADRVEWFMRLDPESRIGGKASEWLNFRIAHYVAFHPDVHSFREADVRAREIADIGDALYQGLRASGMPHRNFARDVAADVVSLGLHSERPGRPFDREVARALLREDIDRRIGWLEEKAPEDRGRTSIGLGRGTINGVQAYEQLLAVRRKLDERGGGPLGGGPGGAAPDGGAAPGVGGSSGSQSPGGETRQGMAFGGVAVVIDGPAIAAGSTLDDDGPVPDPSAATFLGATGVPPPFVLPPVAPSAVSTGAVGH